jgi:hypothetical protein
MIKLVILLLSISLTNADLIHGQTGQFRKYTNQAYKFSFDIPNNWAIKYSKEQDGFICVPATKAEKANYEDCFEGIVFRMEFYKSNLDSALLSDGLYTKTGDSYYTTDRVTDSIQAKNIKGKNWTGIYHNNVCGISCKENGFHAAGGQCEFLYFSNGKTTICINTNGREFDDKVLKRLISSFHFD